MRLLGMAAVAVLAVVIGSVALPAFAGQWGENSHEGRALSKATGATMQQAGDVGKSFGSLIPASVGGCYARGQQHIPPGRPGDPGCLEPSSGNR